MSAQSQGLREEASPSRATSTLRYPTSFGTSMASPYAWRADQQPNLLGLVTPSTSAYPQNAGLGAEPRMNWLPVSDDWDTQWASILDQGLTPEASLPKSDAHHPRYPLVAPQTLQHAYNEGDTAVGDYSPAATSAVSVLPGTPSTRGSNHSTDRGRLYATSSSARTTAYEREQYKEPFIAGAHAQVPITKLLQNGSPEQSDSSPHVPSIQGLTPQHSVYPDSSKSVWPSTYDHILGEFRKFGEGPSEGQVGIPVEDFPTMKQFDMLIQLFFHRFLPSLPILHETLAGSNEYWVLTLAMATIGCHYTKTAEFDRMVVYLHDFLSSALRQEAVKLREPQVEFYYLQAFLLNQIGLMYYGPTEMRDRALLHHGTLIRRAEGLDLFSITTGLVREHRETMDPIMPGYDTTTQWHSWVKEETARRLGYAIWVR